MTAPKPTALPIFDGHNDMLLSLYLPDRGKGRGFFERGEEGHLDLPRMREGGFGGGFFAVFVPNELPKRARRKKSDENEGQVKTEQGYDFPLAPAIDPAYAQRVTLAVAAGLFRLERDAAGQVKVVRTADELERCLGDGTIAMVFHIEGAEAIDPDLNMLEVLYQAGLRSAGIVWSRPNVFAEGVPFRFPSTPDTGPGLTDAGRELVRACNQLGVMVDLSHLNERGFWDVAGLSGAPLVATHSCVHAICPLTRNLTDKQLDAIGESDGLVGINFAVSFLRPDGDNDADTPLELLARHVDYVADRIGIDHVALGSDFDGARVPAELGDAAGLPKLLAVLRARGHNDASLRKITHENWMRVLRRTWKSGG
ncbi:MAG TPA: dipeptidase [Ktedonobacterales bacterium]